MEEPLPMKYVEREGVLRCAYCGSVQHELVEIADSIIITDKPNKFYVIKNNKQYKYYVGH